MPDTASPTTDTPTTNRPANALPDSAPAGVPALGNIERLLASITAIVGPTGILTGPADTAAYVEDWRKLYRGRTPAVVRPSDTAQLSDVVRLCAEAGVHVVPQGGNTSMVGGAVPAEDGTEIVISTARMNRIRAIDSVDMTMTIEAGVTLKAAQLAATDAGCLLPLSISSEGSAQIGGVLAVNAGGNNTVRYGNARDLVLGLEVVLPDGQVWNGLRRLRKDNTGYHLRHLLVGAEGTLGVVTAAVLRLEPRPKELVVAFCALPSAEAASALFRRVRGEDPAALQAFEYMSGAGVRLVLRHIPGVSVPVAAPAEHYVLLELATPRAGAGLRAALEDLLAAAMEDGTVLDAALAESEAQRGAMWKLREEHSEAQKREGASVKNDVSVPTSRVAAFIAAADDACARLMPGIRPMPFGHFGDGNVHYNLLCPDGMDKAVFEARGHEIMDAVNEVVRTFDGSFSAEHGVGQLKAYMMPDWRGGAELDAMRHIKGALDPLGLMNPGKIFPTSGAN